MKIEYTPRHHRREHNASETTQASFLATLVFTINLARKDTVTVFQRHYALYDILQNTYSKLK